MTIDLISGVLTGIVASFIYENVRNAKMPKFRLPRKKDDYKELEELTSLRLEIY